MVFTESSSLEVPFPPYSTSTTTTFNLYARTQSGLSPFTFSVNGGPGQECDSTRILDQTIQESISNFVYASWVFGGLVVLTFILIPMIQPSLLARASTSRSIVQSNAIQLLPVPRKIDSFSSNTPTDMSFLNEDVAGAGASSFKETRSFNPIHETKSNFGQSTWAMRILIKEALFKWCGQSLLKCFILSFRNSYIQCRQSNLKRWASIWSDFMPQSHMAKEQIGQSSIIPRSMTYFSWYHNCSQLSLIVQLL